MAHFPPTFHTRGIYQPRYQPEDVDNKSEEQSPNASRNRSSSVVKKKSKRLHEQVISQWIICESRDQTFEHAWFFFEIVVSATLLAPTISVFAELLSNCSQIFVVIIIRILIIIKIINKFIRSSLPNFFNS